MDCRLPTAAYLPVICPRKGFRRTFRTCSLLCFARDRGFGTEPTRKGKSGAKTPKENVPMSSDPSKAASEVLRTRKNKAPDISSNAGRRSNDTIFDRQFLEKVESVRRSALEQKKAEVDRIYQPIDYDTPMESEQSTIGLGTKVGVGVAVLLFGLVFAFGDFVPFGSDVTSRSNTVIEKNLSEEEKSKLEEMLQQFEETLRKLPEDPAALEGAAVTLVELGEYGRASSLLEKLIKEMPENVDAYRLLGEVKYELMDYEGSVSAYKCGLSTSKGLNFEALRGLTNALLAAKKPDEAVQVILSAREQLNDGKSIGLKYSTDKLNEVDKKNQEIEPIQVELLLGKAYSDWGHVSDAVSIYDQLISKFPNDFRGYLAKGIVLKENGKAGDAERMFIQLPMNVLCCFDEVIPAKKPKILYDIKGTYGTCFFIDLSNIFKNTCICA